MTTCFVNVPDCEYNFYHLCGRVNSGHDGQHDPVGGNPWWGWKSGWQSKTCNGWSSLHHLVHHRILAPVCRSVLSLIVWAMHKLFKPKLDDIYFIPSLPPVTPYDLEVEIISNTAMKLCRGKLIVARLMFTTKYSCCYNSLKLPCLHTQFIG